MTSLSVGDQAPWFQAPALDANPNFHFEAVAGRVVLLMLGGSMAWPACAAALQTIMAHRRLFDDEGACFFGVSTDPEDAAQQRIAQQLPGIRWFVDHDHRISKLYGSSVDEGSRRKYTPVLLLLDHRLRVAGRFGIEQAQEAVAAAVRLVALGCETETAPVLVIPRVFEPDVCRHLIGLYDQAGGTESGFMREQDGMTVGVMDHSFKRRADYHIEDLALQNALKARLAKRILPEVERAFQYTVTRIERWLVACYDGDKAGGYFRAHRDNTTRGTAHRRFACTINLNAEDFEGGELRFPEYGGRRYRAPTGGAVIFSCSLLHEALPVTRGRRYAFLPFFYDDSAAKIREENQKYCMVA
jgi:predicted 2-oxoglutarate/Fe(II)-dependent dioxygenase YbiX/peroxiredoxin